VRSFRPSRAKRVRAVLVGVSLLSAAATSHAQPSAPSGAAALIRARAAWDKGDFDLSEPLYKQALIDGGLLPVDVVDAYVHMGAARAVMGKAKPALDAFRHAAIIDAKFTVPSEAGKKAVKLGEQARREKARVGSIALSAEFPTGVKSGQPFTIDATLDAAHVPLVANVGIVARDSLSNKTYSKNERPSASMHFEVPTDMTLPGASLVVRIDALDAHANRLASSEQRVKVEAQPVAVSTTTTPPPRLTFDGSGPSREKTQKDRADKPSGGFWSSPWPYVIGGAALAAGGAAAFFVTRHTDDVTVGGPHLQPAAR
jgi:hypothetical protein